MRRFWQRPRRPRWSLKVIYGGALFIVGVSCAAALLFPEMPVLVRAEVVSVILSVALLFFLSVSLYLGVRLDPRERIRIEWAKLDPEKWKLECLGVDTGGMFTELGAEGGVGGAIVGFLLDILVSLFLGFLISLLLWLGLNVVVGTVLILFLPGFYLFRRSIRVVLARGRSCRGKIVPSGLYALLATILYTGWFHAILWLARFIVEKLHS